MRVQGSHCFQGELAICSDSIGQVCCVQYVVMLEFTLCADWGGISPFCGGAVGVSVVVLVIDRYA